MRILHVVKHYAPNYNGGIGSTRMNIGGVEKVVVDMTEGLAERGKQVRVLACQGRRAGGTRFIQAGVEVEIAASLGVRLSTPLSPAFFARWSSACAWADIIHVHEPFPLATLATAAWPTRKPVVVSWHADIVRQELLGRYIFRPLQRRLCNQAARILPTSRRLAEHSNVLRPFLAKCTPVPIGIPLDRFESTGASRRLADELRGRFGRFGLAVGRLVYYKGLDILVEALARAPNVHFVIAGEGPLELGLRARTEALGIADRVTIIGSFIPNEDLPAWYQACEFVAMPSTSVAEGFGIVQIEAMASRKPVINSDLPTGVPEVSLHEQTGLTVSVGSVEELAAALHRLWHNPTEARAFGEAGRRRAHAEFTRSRMVDRLVEVYRKLRLAA